MVNILHKSVTVSLPKLSLVAELRRAIVKDHLSLVYLPQVNLRTGRITGVEALARWYHLELGWIPPSEFIPLAEETGFIMPLTLWVANAALRQLESWHQEGLAMNISINISAANLQATEFPEQVRGLLARYVVPYPRLGIEMAESAIMTDSECAIAALTQMKEMGLKLALDDFGTGCSALSYLARLPIDEVKIDRPFIKNVSSHKNNRIIVQAIINLAHDLGLRVVAEGVETQAEKDLLLELRCDEAQGFYFTQPLPAAELMVWLREHCCQAGDDLRCLRQML
jgi:EAL domain-containing protein (putative c-di-GMP-specific phosphodiesterase class I)